MGDLLRCADCGRVIKQVRSYSKIQETGYPIATIPINVPDSLNLGKQAARKGVCVLRILIQLCWETIRKQMEVFLDTQRVLHQLIALEQEKAKRDIPSSQLQKLQGRDCEEAEYDRLIVYGL